MYVYYSSPNDNLTYLFENSYVSLFPHIAFYMGFYFIDTKKIWIDADLKKPYKFEDRICFKKNRNPTGIPTLYKIRINPKDIILHKNFPFEFRIKNKTEVKKIKKSEIMDLLKQSIKMSHLYDDINEID